MPSNCRSVEPCGKDSTQAVYRVSAVGAMGATVGASGFGVRPPARHENALILAVVSEGFTLSPWWSAYAVVLVVLFVWIRRLSAEVTRQDAAEPEREIAPLLRDMGAGE